MRESDYVNLYINILESTMETVLTRLRYEFIKYYGKEYTDKINKIFDNLTFVYIGENKPKYVLLDDQEEYLDLLYDLRRKSNFSGSEIVNYALSPQVEINQKTFDFRKKFMSYAFSCWGYQKKKNRDNESIYLGASKEINDKKIIDLAENSTQSGAYMEISDDYDYLTFIKISNGQIPLHDLIHEINHHLTKESIYKITNNDESEEIYTTIGITDDSKDLINELINEYVSKDILDSYDKIYFDDPYVDKDFDSGYIMIDKLCGDPIKQIYELLLEVVKKNLINGNCVVIKKIINNDNKDNYYNLDVIFKILKKHMEIKKKNNIIKRMSEYPDTIDNIKKLELLDAINKLLNSIKKSCNNYFKYQNDCNMYIEELISSGKATKL